MRAITVRQPWAWAIVYAGKRVENRSRREPWHTAIGQCIAIHAGKADYDEDDLLDVADLASDFTWEDRDYLEQRGVILGAATLVGLHHARSCDTSCSPWAQPDQWHLVLTDVVPLVRPIPCRGYQGLWTIPAPIAAHLEQAA